MSLAVGGDCLADIDQLRSRPRVFGPVASDPTVLRLIATLAADVSGVVGDQHRPCGCRQNAWRAAGAGLPITGADGAHPVIIDLDATLVGAHSEKNRPPHLQAGIRFHPLCAFVDHGAGGTGEPVAMLLRPGNAGANTAADHITVTGQALAQLPMTTGYRVGRKVLIRTDSAGGTHEFLDYLTRRHLGYSVGIGLTGTWADQIGNLLPQAWTPA